MTSLVVLALLVTGPLSPLVRAVPCMSLSVDMQKQARNNEHIGADLAPSDRDALAFSPRGVGGGGSFFSPSLHPFDPKQLWVSSDM